MAKLKANGTELHRMERTRVLDSEEDQEQETERVTYSLRSNGKVLWKMDFFYGGRQYGGQWKVHPVTQSRRLTPEKMERVVANLEGQGYSHV